MKKNNMKINSLLSTIAAVSLLLASGCAKQEENSFEQVSKMTFVADMEYSQTEQSDTKTIMSGTNDDAVRSVHWLLQDKIGISSGAAFSQFIYEGTEPMAVAEFTGELPVGEKYYAVYPYSASATISSETLGISLPAIQAYKANSFDNGAFPMVAVSTTPELHFKNLCGILKLNLIGDVKVSSIAFSAKDASGNDIKVSGAATVNMAYESTPVLSMASTAENTVTLDCGEGVQLNTSTATPFFIVLPPITYANFTLVISTENDAMIKTSSSLVINRSNIRPTDDLAFSSSQAIDLSENGTANCYIVSNAGRYALNAKVIGNGAAGLLPSVSQDLKKFHATTTDISPLSAKLIWQDVENLISGVSLDSEGVLHFMASPQKGNALVAVYDNEDPDAAEAKILWSWHIWCTDTPADENYLNWEDRAFTLMDRNLGATAALPSSDLTATYGLSYQWGRKDPFSRNSENLSIAASSYTNGTISNTIEHPNTFYTYYSSDNYDWYYGTERNDYLWGNYEGYNTTYTAAKSIYDPCPSGYMVTPKDTWTYFSTSTGTWNSTGYTFNTNSGGGTTWYPAAGYRHIDGSLINSGSGFYFSSSPYSSSSYYAGDLYFNSDKVNLLGDYRVAGFSVRCSRVPQGEEFIDFTISSPLLGTATATEITATTAKIGGEVTNLGGARVTERGVVYSTSANPTISTGTKVTCTIPEGTNGKGSFSVDLTGLTTGTTYYYKAYAINAAGTGYGEEKSFTTVLPNVTDLSVNGTANCYIVSSAGRYSLKADVIGNGSDGLLTNYTQEVTGFHTTSAVIAPLSAQLIWEDAAGLVSNVALSEDKTKVLFDVSELKGNASIAVYDNADPNASGAAIIWSWHIWCTDEPTEQTYVNASNESHILMDRNLGATLADPGSTDAERLATYGLFYQWGRKDPFPGSSSINTSTFKTISGKITAIESKISGGADIAYSISHPYTFIHGGYIENIECGWLSNNKYLYLWGNPYGFDYDPVLYGGLLYVDYSQHKTVYDPCPMGYYVPKRDVWTGLSVSNVSGNYNCGWTFYLAAGAQGGTSYYPASGELNYAGGFSWRTTPGSASIYTTSAYNGTWRYCCMFENASDITVLYPDGAPGDGGLVRCEKIQ